MQPKTPHLALRPYRLHEAELDLPTSWTDQSMQLFRIPLESGGDASFIVTRDYEAVGVDASGYAEAQQVTLKEKFSEFRLLSAQTLELGGVQAAQLDYEWSSNGVVLRQRQAYVPTPEAMLTLTLTARTATFDRLDIAWESVARSLRLRSVTASVPNMR